MLMGLVEVVRRSHAVAWSAKPVSSQWLSGPEPTPLEPPLLNPLTSGQSLLGYLKSPPWEPIKNKITRSGENHILKLQKLLRVVAGTREWYHPSVTPGPPLNPGGVCLWQAAEQAIFLCTSFLTSDYVKHDPAFTLARQSSVKLTPECTQEELQQHIENADTHFRGKECCPSML